MTIEDLIKTLQKIQKKHPSITIECCMDNDWTGTLDSVKVVESYELKYASNPAPTCLLYFSD